MLNLLLLTPARQATILGGMTEHALLVPRVSTKEQSEADSIPLMRAYAEQQGYKVHHVEPIHGKSAFHGRHLKQLHKAIQEHVINGPCTIIIFRDVDRSSRQGAQATFDLRGMIIKAGARMEFSGQTYLNDQRTQEMLLGLLATSAKEESETKSRRTKQGNTVKRANGELVGIPPWGYERGTVDGKEILVPTEDGRKWVPVIYQACADGKSVAAIQRLLKGVHSPHRETGLWGDIIILRLIKNPTYCGMRPNKGNMQYEPLVDPDLWQEANAALKARTLTGRSTVKRETPLVKPLCGKCYGKQREGNPTGKSPMYIQGGRRLFYCRGTGPIRSGCNAIGIDPAELEQVVQEAMSVDMQPHYEGRWTPGDDKAQRSRILREQIAQAARDGQLDIIPELTQQALAIEAEQPREAAFVQHPTGMTVGEWWLSLSRDQQREELTKHEITAEVVTDKWGKYVRATIVPKSFLEDL